MVNPSVKDLAALIYAHLVGESFVALDGVDEDREKQLRELAGLALDAAVAFQDEAARREEDGRALLPKGRPTG